MAGRSYWGDFVAELLPHLLVLDGRGMIVDRSEDIGDYIKRYMVDHKVPREKYDA
jgi:hypothetical protein